MDDKTPERTIDRRMEKLALHTPDLTAQNVDKLAQLFPNCVTESRDAGGKLIRAIDFDQLRQELSADLDRGNSRIATV